MNNELYQREFKIKHAGAKLRVFLVPENVVIKNTFIHYAGYRELKREFWENLSVEEFENLLARSKFNPTAYHNDPEETTGGCHRNRIYLEVVSPFYNPNK
jgi:hypothetical protein